jgi:putative ABC transport system permease protein
MGLFGEMWRRVGMLLRRDAAARELEEEMRLHREMKERELIERGASEDESQYAAARAFGNGLSLTERSREAWGWRWLEDFGQDLRYGARTLRKNFGFAATAILTLALGIGANTAIFSVVNTVLLQQLPYRDPGRLVWVDEYSPRMNDSATPNPEYTNWALNNHTFEAMAALGGGLPMNLTKAGEPEQIDAGIVTPNLLDMLGVRPALGRPFTPEEGLPGGNRVVILTDGLWKKKFGADPNVVGKGVELDQESYTIVGVMPAGFQYPQRGFKPELLGALQLPPKVDWSSMRLQLTQTIGRLKPGVTIEQAQADLAELSRRTSADMPAGFAHMRDGLQVQTTRLHDKLVGDVRPTLLMLLAAVGGVLLIACVNIANLQLARTANRQKELAVRAAIGASRLRLVRQLLTEGALIAFLGGAVGLAFAAGGVCVLQAYAPQNFLEAKSITMDRWVMLFMLGITCATVALFAAIPSLRASKPDVDAKLKDGRDTASSSAGQRRVRSVLAVCELALAVVLVAASGLLLRSFVLLSNVDPGFDASHVLTVSTMLPMTKYRDAVKRNAFYDEMLRKVRALPGVRSAGLTTSLPLTNFTMIRTFSVEGQPDKQAEQTPPVVVEHVSPGYFETLRVPLLAGRAFEELDSKSETHMVIANQAFVQKYIGGEPQAAVGKRMRFGNGPGPALPWETIAGVVASVRHAKLDHEADPEIYVARGHGGLTETIAGLAVRTELDPRSLAGAVRDAVQQVDPEQPVFDVRTMEQRIAEAASGTRFNATLLGFFGVVALALAVVGVYGVIAYSVAERTHEIGIRVALGASRGNVAGMVMGQGMVMTVAGLVFGLAGALFATRFLSSLLYGIQPRDPVILGTAAGVLGVVALAACWVPARRAMRVDPMVALRHE